MEGDTTVGNTANIRRLHFEACTFLMADMKTQVASTDPSEPVRKLAICGEAEQFGVTEAEDHRFVA